MAEGNERTQQIRNEMVMKARIPFIISLHFFLSLQALGFFPKVGTKGKGAVCF